MKNHPQGKGCAGHHGQCTDFAYEIVKLLQKIPGVHTAPSGIQTSHTMAGGRRRVSITDAQGGLTLRVRQSHSMQELKVYYPKGCVLKLEIARTLRDNGIPICFKDW